MLKRKDTSPRKREAVVDVTGEQIRVRCGDSEFTIAGDGDAIVVAADGLDIHWYDGDEIRLSVRGSGQA